MITIRPTSKETAHVKGPGYLHFIDIVVGQEMVANDVSAIGEYAELIQIVIQTGNMTACLARFIYFGLSVRSNPILYSGGINDEVELGSTDVQVDINADSFFSVMMTPEQAAKLPNTDNQNFAVLYRSNTGGDWPVFESSAGVFESVHGVVQ